MAGRYCIVQSRFVPTGDRQNFGLTGACKVRSSPQRHRECILYQWGQRCVAKPRSDKKNAQASGLQTLPSQAHSRRNSAHTGKRDCNCCLN